MPRSKPEPPPKSKPGRYTPPSPKKAPPSPLWLPILMFIGFGLGIAVIVVNYLAVLPGGAKNSYLFLGLGLITAGFVLSTQYH